MRSTSHTLALLIVLAWCSIAHADTIFNFSATINSIPGTSRGYPPTSEATGTLTIDTVLGVVTGASIETVVTTFDYVNFTSRDGNFVDIRLTNEAPPFPSPPPVGLSAMDIFLPVSSLMGYMGGLGCSLTYQPVSCPSIPSQISIEGPTAAFADTLSLSPAVVQAPELNSFLLLGTGLLGLAAPIRYRRRFSAD